MSNVNADGDFERKDEIRHRLRGILRLTSSKQKVRLLCGHVGLVKKGFHCRTREELQAVDDYLRKHFPQQMTAGVQIPAAAMEEKLLSIERASGIGECMSNRGGRAGGLVRCRLTATWDKQRKWFQPDLPDFFCVRAAVQPHAPTV